MERAFRRILILCGDSGTARMSTRSRSAAVWAVLLLVCFTSFIASAQGNGGAPYQIRVFALPGPVESLPPTDAPKEELQSV